MQVARNYVNLLEGTTSQEDVVTGWWCFPRGKKEFMIQVIPVESDDDFEVIDVHVPF